MFNYKEKERSVKEPFLWSKHTEYQIEGDLIVPGKGPLEKYDPMDYYKDPLTIDMVERIFGENKSKNTDMYIHTSFASLDLDNEQEILNWINIFGLPFIPFLNKDETERKKIYASKKDIFFPHDIKNLYRKTQTFTLPSPSIPRNVLLKEGLIWETDGIYIEEVKEEIRRVKYILELKKAKDKKDFSALSKNAHEILCYWQLYVPEYQPDNEQDVIFDAAVQQYITEMFNTALRNVTPIIFFENENSEWKWRFDALLAALYIMFSLDVTESRIPQKCSYINCNTYFRPSKSTNFYCSSQCQDNAKTYRAKEKKKTKALELWKSGKTSEEIVKMLKVEPYRLKGWANQWEGKNGRKH